MRTKEKITPQLLHPRHQGVFYFKVPRKDQPYEKAHWIDVTDDLRNISDSRMDCLVARTQNLFYREQVTVDDESFNRFLKRRGRQEKRRKVAEAVYGQKRRIGPGKAFDATLLSLLVVLGTLHFVS